MAGIFVRLSRPPVLDRPHPSALPVWLQGHRTNGRQGASRHPHPNGEPEITTAEPGAQRAPRVDRKLTGGRCSLWGRCQPGLDRRWSLLWRVRACHTGPSAPHLGQRQGPETWRRCGLRDADRLPADVISSRVLDSQVRGVFTWDYLGSLGRDAGSSTLRMKHTIVQKKSIWGWRCALLDARCRGIEIRNRNSEFELLAILKMGSVRTW